MVRALYEWIIENDCTPYLLVNAMADDVLVPMEYVKNGQIVLNISPNAIIDLQMTNEAVMFNGRFGGVPMDVYAPMESVMGIYTRENGQGMVFEYEEPETDPEPPTKPKVSAVKNDKQPEKKSGPGLTLVK